MNKPELTWKDIVRDALLKLGGQGHLSEINKIVESHPKTRQIQLGETLSEGL